MAGDGSVRLRVRVPAKINVHLSVGPRRPDGYHDLVTVLQTVSLHDTLRVRCDDGQALHPTARPRMGLVLTADGVGDGDVPLGDDNLVLVAGRRRQQAEHRPSVAKRKFGRHWMHRSSAQPGSRRCCRCC